ncbi:ATP-dependent DNA helicase PIF1 [Hypsizygus marmoreus]|uniref:ATP-dependent DNA helicase n=1 Tax=Hypsizygus marmoreus TaxID=39966 RepID=A0A369JXQ2_HYPMA|nr:ATP-dependent DNA helicase PIF1 [Hypsizygus marmoreus]
MTNEGWQKPQPDMLPEDLDLNPDPPHVDQTGSEWKATVMKVRSDILEQRERNLPQTVNSAGHAKSNVVEVVDKSYLERKCQTAEWTSTINNIISEFQLNNEQERAFRIVANHAINPNSDQLKMYIGGMGGTGKTQVLKALMAYFEARKESHRFVVVAPTGTAASLLGGSTYHFMFGISDMNESIDYQSAQVKSRLTGVDYVFLDEVSMLSCRDLYRISSQLAQILGYAEIPFGGMNMIFAGDFAQLPPALGQEGASLYSRTVGTRGVNLHDQQAAIGKALWHQVTTVVILRQNMRQKLQTTDDAKLRLALENMRYKSCTPEDLIYLRSRISSNALGRSSITDKEFRHVSVITALNVDKDSINLMGSLRFAEESGQSLTHFFSDDLVTPPEDDENRKQRKAAGNKVLVRKKMVSNDVQKALWDAPHSANTKIIPGTLSLCIGLPVMIRQNAATELCMTRGQEGFVHSWQSATGGRGQRILDTLFVQLSNPPRPVHLPGLPANVVPLTKTTVATVCSLPDDSTLNVSRTQIEVLPNFAMTDYASQGKTRIFNVVHLNNSRSHQAIYTALSRSASASGTLILQGFDAKKVVGGASGALRQEFRELELLDNVTRLRYQGKLPKSVHDADRRNTLIDSFRSCKGLKYMPPSLHSALRWNTSDPFLDWVVKDVEWQVITKANAKYMPPANNNFIPAKGTIPSSQVGLPAANLPLADDSKKRKRKAGKDLAKDDHLTEDMPKLKKIKTVHWSADTDVQGNLSERPIGVVWQNNSCAYDATITILHSIWCQDPETLSPILSEFNPEFLGPLVTGFAASMELEPIRLDNARNDLQQALLAKCPRTFPLGRYISVHAIFDYLFTSSEVLSTSARYCSRGHTVSRREETTKACHLVVLCTPNTALQQYIQNYRVESSATCRVCKRHLIRIHTFVNAPPVLAFDLSRVHPSFSSQLTVPVSSPSGPSNIKYRLAGIVYYGGQHFVCRVITPSGSVWKHDGIMSGASTELEGSIGDVHLTYLGTRDPVIAVYVRES